MPILQSSRYATSNVVALVGPDGTLRRWLTPRKAFIEAQVNQRWVEHVFQAGEELDLLAANYLNDSALWWVIADVNDIVFPWDITPGTRLMIPVTDVKTWTASNAYRNPSSRV